MINGYNNTSQYMNKNNPNQTLGIILRPRNTLKHTKGIIERIKKEKE